MSTSEGADRSIEERLIGNWRNTDAQSAASKILTALYPIEQVLGIPKDAFRTLHKLLPGIGGANASCMPLK